MVYIGSQSSRTNSPSLYLLPDRSKFRPLCVSGRSRFYQLVPRFRWSGALTIWLCVPFHSCIVRTRRTPVGYILSGHFGFRLVRASTCSLAGLHSTCSMLPLSFCGDSGCVLAGASRAPWLEWHAMPLLIRWSSIGYPPPLLSELSRGDIPSASGPFAAVWYGTTLSRASGSLPAKRAVSRETLRINARFRVTT